MIGPLPPGPGPEMLLRLVPQNAVEADGFTRMLDAIAARGPDLPMEPADGNALSAQIFNEQGFFGSAPAPARAPGPAGGGPLQLTMQDGDAPSLPQDSARPEPGMAQSPEARMGPRLVGHRVTPTAQGAFPAAISSVCAQITVPPSTARCAAPLPELGELEVPHSLARPQPRQLPAGTCAAIDVALHELAAGLLVAVQVDALDETERTQLHDEIAALLARHGLSATTIQIGARRTRAPARGGTR